MEHQSSCAEVAAAVGRRRPLQARDLRVRRLGKIRLEAAVAHRLARNLLEESTG